MIIQYEHHGREVYVDEALRGKHREHCLCFQCDHFLPDGDEHRDRNCQFANLLFAFDQAFGMVTPVWECPYFRRRDSEEVRI